MSFQIGLSDQSKASARFIRRVHRELQKAFSHRSKQGLTQQALAKRLGINRATINKRLMGHDNLTLRSIADLAWAMDSDVVFKVEPRELAENVNVYHAEALSPQRKKAGSTSFSPTTSVANFTIKASEVHG